MFNDKYGLTEAVLSGVKTQTRRNSGFDEGMNPHLTLLLRSEKGREEFIDKKSRYKVGEVVAIAQSYRDCKRFVCLQESAGWSNKMFVKADLMPHHIKITNIRLERLQDISDDDCLKEGVFGLTDSMNPSIGTYTFSGANRLYSTPKEAFASLIDATCGRGTYDSNPYVFVYDFRIIRINILSLLFKR